MATKIKYNELPMFIRDTIPEEDFLAGYLSTDKNDANIIVRIADHSSNRPAEEEYNPMKMRRLSLGERKENIPLPETKTIEDLNLEIRITYSFEDKTNILQQHYQVFELDQMTQVGKHTEPYFSAFKGDLVAIAKSALRKYRFPSEYSQWSPDQKIIYWVERLYKMRRQAGESGSDEDIAFDKTLANAMQSIDPEIKGLLPECIMKLAQLEQIDHAELLSSFRERTGLFI